MGARLSSTQNSQSKQAETAAAASADEDVAVYAAVFADVFQATADTQIMIVDHTSIGVPPGMWAVTSVKGQDTAKFMAKACGRWTRSRLSAENEAVRFAASAVPNLASMWRYTTSST